MFESKAKRRIRELEAENKLLREETAKQRELLDEMKVRLEQAVKALDKRNGELRRAVFAEEVGLLPCESPACKFCKNAVWHSDTDGRHIAGCLKGVQCADFTYQEPKEESPPVATGATPNLFPGMAWSGAYPFFNPRYQLEQWHL